MPQSSIFFQSACLRIDLVPDSRGYVLFKLSKQDPNNTGKFTPLYHTDALTCEYLVDLIATAVDAAKWISVNCEEIKEDNRHLYFKFKEALDVRSVS